MIDNNEILKHTIEKYKLNLDKNFNFEKNK
ncbi:unknown [Clostridium sp. CAG:440]|nr:unknown [Clostridium sp. CAG:440]